MNTHANLKFSLLELCATLSICLIILLPLIGPVASAHRVMNLDAGHSTGTVTTSDAATFQFSSGNFSVNEGANAVTITVTRTGDTSVSASVDCSTSDGTAEQRTDYTLVANTLAFLPGETSKTFEVPIVDDLYVEPPETINLKLSNPSGVAILGSPSTATLTIVDNDSTPPFTNPLDNANALFFVRQHYLDFLSREPDPGGLGYWASQITNCGSDQNCIRRHRLDVSNAFFYELEFQQTGAYVYRLYRAAYGNDQPFPNPDPGNITEAKKIPKYDAFVADRARVIAGTNQAQAQLDLANVFVRRAEFLAKYPASLGGPEFVDAILGRIKIDNGVDLASQRNALLNLFNQGGRGAVLYRLSDDNLQANPINNRAFIDAEYNRSFVYTQYAGYLRRDSDIGGFLFWLSKVNEFPVRNADIQHTMVCAFITSAEYQQRFSSVVIHHNSECGAAPPPADLTPDQRVAALERVRSRIESLSANPNRAEVNQELLNFIRSQPEFAEAGISNDSCVWAKYTDGVEIIVINNRPPLSSVGASTRTVAASISSNAKPENLPNSIKARLVQALSSAFANAVPEVRTWLNEQNYSEPINEGATVEALKTVGGDGIFYLSAHGGIAGTGTQFRVTTATLVSVPKDIQFENDLRMGRLVHTVAIYDRNPSGGFNYASTYGITSQFVQDYWSNFSPNSFVFIDACSSSSPEALPFQMAIKDKVASVYAGWTGIVNGEPSSNTVRFVFDRLLGANKVYLEAGFKQRPFDYRSVAQDFQYHGVGKDTENGSELTFTPLNASGDGFQLLAPSIQNLAVDEFTSTLVISGIFGEDLGSASRAVFVGGREIHVSDWTPSLIECDLPKSGSGSAGEVIVTVHQQKSNTAYLTEWQGPFTHVVTADGTLKQTATYNVRFRADIRRVRYHIHEDPHVIDISRILMATEDSVYDFLCNGQNTANNVTESWSGSGMLPRLANPPNGAGAFEFSGWVTDDRKLNLVLTVGSDSRIVTITSMGSSTTMNQSLFSPRIIANPVQVDLDQNGNIIGRSVGGTDNSGNHHTLSWNRIDARFPPGADSPR